MITLNLFCKKNNNFIYKKSFGSKEFLSVLKNIQKLDWKLILGHY